MKTRKAFEIYGLIGKSFLACAGGIVGFVLGGPLFAIPGIILGIIGGHLMEKAVVHI